MHATGGGVVFRHAGVCVKVGDGCALTSHAMSAGSRGGSLLCTGGGAEVHGENVRLYPPLPPPRPPRLRRPAPETRAASYQLRAASAVLLRAQRSIGSVCAAEALYANERARVTHRYVGVLKITKFVHMHGSIPAQSLYDTHARQCPR